MQQITSLSYADARRAIDAIQTELARRGKTGVVAVADPSGELIALARFEGAPLASILIATNKAFTAARERKPTLDIGAGLRAKNYDVAFYGDPRYVGWAMGFVKVGYAVVLQDCRGRHDSNGRWEPYVCEVPDGAPEGQAVLAPV